MGGSGLLILLVSDHGDCARLRRFIQAHFYWAVLQRDMKGESSSALLPGAGLFELTGSPTPLSVKTFCILAEFNNNVNRYCLRMSKPAVAAGGGWPALPHALRATRQVSTLVNF
jgi:hypothetical protein